MFKKTKATTAAIVFFAFSVVFAQRSGVDSKILQRFLVNEHRKLIVDLPAAASLIYLIAGGLTIRF